MGEHYYTARSHEQYHVKSATFGAMGPKGLTSNTHAEKFGVR